MAWMITGRPITQRVTRKLAQEFSNMTAAPHDRVLSERRLQVYSKMMAAGDFRPIAWASAFCAETEETYRINGKHTSTLLSGMEKMPELYITVEHFHCDTLEDVAKLYGTYDSKLQSRTTSDINRTFASCVTELKDVPIRIINTTVSGINYHIHGDKYYSIPPVVRAEVLFEHNDFATWIYGILGDSKTVSHIIRMPVFAAVFGTYQKDKEAATRFWQAVKQENGLSPDDPDRKLAKFLLTNASWRGHMDSRHLTKKNRITDREFYVKSLKAWSLWRKGERGELRYQLDMNTPEIV